jgi:hypothetical protein
LNGRPEWVQYAALITFNFFLYPLSFSLLYFSIKGLLRSAAGIAASEVVPNLPVWVCLQGCGILGKSKKSSPCPLTTRMLSDARVRVSAALPNPAGMPISKLAAITTGMKLNARREPANRFRGFMS